MQYKVDFVITAHEHGWERIASVYNGTVMQEGYNSPPAPVYIVNGAAGNREGNEKPAGNAPWSLFQSDALGYGLYEVRADSGAMSIAYTFYDAVSGDVVDALTITK